MTARPSGGSSLSYRACRVFAAVSIVLPIGLCAPAAQAAAALAVPAQDPSVGEEANLALGLAASDVFSLPLDSASAEGLLTIVPVEGFPVILNLEPHSVRSGTYRVLVQGADGSLTKTAPSPVHTLRGSVLGMPGSLVAASVDETGLRARILFADGREHWIEPLSGRIAEADADDHIGYSTGAMMHEPGVCGTDGPAMTIEAVGDHESALRGMAEGSSTCMAEIACDADYEYYQAWGSTAAVEARINEVINAVNIQYQRDVGIAHLVTTIIVRTSVGDPYTSSDPSTLLTEFRNHWTANHTGITRDVAHLFTGRDLTGSTIGIAWVGAVCSSYGYGLSQSDFSSNFASVTDLTAHELGHNWGASHCSCPSYTMNAWLTSANAFDPATSIPEIAAFRDGRSCLSNCNGGPNVECGDPGTGSCFIAHATPYCDDADCCAAVCAADPSCCDTEWDAGCASLAAALCGGGDDEEDAPQDAPLDSFQVTLGALDSGDLAAMDDSDDNHLTALSAATGSKQKVTLTVSALSPVLAATRLDLTLETGASGNSVRATICLWNFNRSKWIQLYSGSEPKVDTVRQYSITTNPGRFIDPESGEVRVKIALQRSSATAYTARVDQIEVSVTP